MPLARAPLEWELGPELTLELVQELAHKSVWESPKALDRCRMYHRNFDKTPLTMSTRTQSGCNWMFRKRSNHLHSNTLHLLATMSKDH